MKKNKISTLESFHRVLSDSYKQTAPTLEQLEDDSNCLTKGSDASGYSDCYDFPTLFDSEAEEYESYNRSCGFANFDELAMFCECQNFTDEECARELYVLLYDDIDLANQYFETLHPYDQETLFEFYMAAKKGFNHCFKYDPDAPLAIYYYEGKYFLAYSSEDEDEPLYEVH